MMAGEVSGMSELVAKGDTSDLALYTKACQALAEAKTVDEVKGIRDKASAMRVYAQQAKNRQLEVDAAEIRMRAERRLGEMIRVQKETVGLATGGEHGGKPSIDGSRAEPSNKRPTLAEAGIDKKLSARAQKMAAVPEEKFEGMLGEWRDRVEKENERVTTNILKEGEKAQRREDRENIKGIDIPADDTEPTIAALEPGWWRVGSQHLYCGSNLDPEFINGTPYAKFAFADPPYNAGVDDWDSDFEWQQDYLQDKADFVAVTPGGWNAYGFYQQTRMTYQWEMACWIRNGMTHGRCGFANWIKTSIFGKKPKIPQDFFDITIKTNETEETAHKGRKPYGYMSMMLDIFTDEGDNVIDPFAGSGTTLLVSEKMGRISYSAELSPEYCAKIIERAKQIGCDHERL